MPQGLVTFLKACAVMVLTFFGVALTLISGRSSFTLDPIGVGIGAAFLVGALIAFVTWFWRRA